MLAISQIEEQFDPKIYLRALASVAHADGVLDVERQFIEQQAASLGIDQEEINLSQPVDLDSLTSTASDLTRRLIVRDCIVLASLDDDYTGNERRHIRHLAARLGVSEDVVGKLEDWVNRYSTILEEGQRLLSTT